MSGGVVVTFLVVDLLLVLTPGADWAYAIAAGLRERSVLPAVAGLVAGYAGHTALLAAGVAVLVARAPSLLGVITVAGAAYLVWLGCTVLARPAAPTADAASTPSRWRATLRGAATSGLNPKGLLLYLALLPRFVDPAARWPVAAQTALLGLVHMADCAVVYLAVGVLAGSVLRARPRLARVVGRAAGVVMIGLGLALLVEQFAG
ncbi:MAG TPA: LysE family translocator [Streptosporangiales bacterium]